MEVRALRSLPLEAQRHRFLDLWTLKESYIKARGMGLSIPLDKFSIDLDSGTNSAIIFDSDFDDFARSMEILPVLPLGRASRCTVRPAMRRNAGSSCGSKRRALDIGDCFRVSNRSARSSAIRKTAKLKGCATTLQRLRQSPCLDLAEQLLRPLGEALAGAVEPEHRGRAVAILQHRDARAVPGLAEAVL